MTRAKILLEGAFKLKVLVILGRLEDFKHLNLPHSKDNHLQIMKIASLISLVKVE